MDNKYNTISFCTSNYNDKYGQTIDEEKLFHDISDFLRIAMKNGYQCKMWFDGVTYVIEFEKNEELSGTSLEWVGEDEYIEKCGGAEPECIEKCDDDIGAFTAGFSWKPTGETEQDETDDSGSCY